MYRLMSLLYTTFGFLGYNKCMHDVYDTVVKNLVKNPSTYRELMSFFFHFYRFLIHFYFIFFFHFNSRYAKIRSIFIFLKNFTLMKFKTSVILIQSLKWNFNCIRNIWDDVFKWNIQKNIMMLICNDERCIMNFSLLNTLLINYFVLRTKN